MSKKSSIDPIYAQLIGDQPIKKRIIERTQISNSYFEEFQRKKQTLLS